MIPSQYECLLVLCIASEPLEIRLSTPPELLCYYRIIMSDLSLMRDQFLYQIPAEVVIKFSQVMDSLPKSDWLRFGTLNSLFFLRLNPRLFETSRCEQTRNTRAFLLNVFRV